MKSQIRSDLQFIRELCETAIGQGPGKWEANTRFVSWLRANPDVLLALLDVADKAEGVRSNPGGLAHSRLYRALDSLPGLRRVA